MHKMLYCHTFKKVNNDFDFDKQQSRKALQRQEQIYLFCAQNKGEFKRPRITINLQTIQLTRLHHLSFCKSSNSSK